MIGNSFDAYQILFPGPLGWELWLLKNGEAKLLSSESTGGSDSFDPSVQGKLVLAQATTQQIALPLVSSASDPESLVQAARLHVEKQGSEFDEEGIMVEQIRGSSQKTVARVDAPLSKLNEDAPVDQTPDLIVAAPTLMPLKEDSIAIWVELGNVVVAFEKGGSVIYYDKLSCTGHELAKEVYRIMIQLEGDGLIESPKVLSLWGVPGEFFEDKLQLEVEVEPRPAPTRIPKEPGQHPSWFREREDQNSKSARKKRQLQIMLIVFGVLAFSFSVFFLTRYFQVRTLKAEIAALRPQVERIEGIQSRWNEVSTGVDPDSSFLEVWMNIFSLESIASVKIERMRISRAEIELMGNAEEASQALEFIEELSTSDMFQGYAWEFHPPNIAAGGAATFEIRGVK